MIKIAPGIIPFIQHIAALNYPETFLVLSPVLSSTQTAPLPPAFLGASENASTSGC